MCWLDAIGKVQMFTKNYIVLHPNEYTPHKATNDSAIFYLPQMVNN